MKIVVIGAGSASFGRGMVADLLTEPCLQGPETEIVLVDVSAAALETMTQAALRAQTAAGSHARISKTTDRCEALPGADFVLIAVAVRRMELWEQDFRVPQAHGVRHVLGENGGPGAVFHTMRSLKLIVPICRDVEKLCPEAWVLNFTNPEARVLHAMRTLTKVKSIGLCHGVFWAESLASKWLGIPLEHLEITSAGMNHAYCVLKAVDKRTGEDRIGEFLRMAQDCDDPGFCPLFQEFARIFDVVTFPSDDHVGEYFAYGSEFHGDKWVYGMESRQVTEAGDSRSVSEKFVAGDASAEEMLQPSGELAVPIIRALQGTACERMSAVDVLNDGGYVENLPRDVVVEVPALVDREGVRPLKVGPIPEVFAVGLRTQYAIHGLLTEAYRTGSKKLLLQALLLDPCITGIGQGKRILDDMLSVQREYLPEFS